MVLSSPGEQPQPSPDVPVTEGDAEQDQRPQAQLNARDLIETTEVKGELISARAVPPSQPGAQPGAQSLPQTAAPCPGCCPGVHGAVPM